MYVVYVFLCNIVGLDTFGHLYREKDYSAYSVEHNSYSIDI